MIVKGYEMIEKAVKEDCTLITRFRVNPLSKRQIAERQEAEKLIHMIGALISDNTDLCTMNPVDGDDNYIEVTFTKEAIKEVYNLLVKEGVISE